MDIKNLRSAKNFPNENEELKFRVNELNKNFLALKIEMEVQQENLKRIVELNKLLVPNLNIEKIASSFFSYLGEIFDFDECGIIVQNEEYIFLNEIKLDGVSKLTRIEDENVKRIMESLYLKIKETKKSLLLNKDNLEQLSYNNANSLICFPILNGKVITGAILFQSKKEEVYTKREIKLIEELIKSSMPKIINRASQFSQILETNSKDSLTKLYNHDFFDSQILDKYISENKLFSLIIIEINNLKRISELYGISTIEEVLKEFGKILKLFSHKKYSIARYEEDKFAITLPSYSLEESEIVANKIKNYLLEKNILKLDLSYSIGIADFSPKLGINKEKLIENIDSALFSSKLTGINKVVTFRIK